MFRFLLISGMLWSSSNGFLFGLFGGGGGCGQCQSSCASQCQMMCPQSIPPSGCGAAAPLAPIPPVYNGYSPTQSSYASFPSPSYQPLQPQQPRQFNPFPQYPAPSAPLPPPPAFQPNPVSYPTFQQQRTSFQAPYSPPNTGYASQALFVQPAPARVTAPPFPSPRYEPQELPAPARVQVEPSNVYNKPSFSSLPSLNVPEQTQQETTFPANMYSSHLPRLPPSPFDEEEDEDVVEELPVPQQEAVPASEPQRVHNYALPKPIDNRVEAPLEETQETVTTERKNTLINYKFELPNRHESNEYHHKATYEQTLPRIEEEEKEVISTYNREKSAIPNEYKRPQTIEEDEVTVVKVNPTGKETERIYTYDTSTSSERYTERPRIPSIDEEEVIVPSVTYSPPTTNSYRWNQTPNPTSYIPPVKQTVEEVEEEFKPLTRGEGGPSSSIGESGYEFGGMEEVTVPVPTSNSGTEEVGPESEYHKHRDPSVPNISTNKIKSEFEIYDDLAEEQSTTKKIPNITPNTSISPSLTTLQFTFKDASSSKCNSVKLMNLMHSKMTHSPSISKQLIFSAAGAEFSGRSLDVICSRHSFSYIVVTSPTYCEHRKAPVTCFAFFQP